MRKLLAVFVTVAMLALLPAGGWAQSTALPNRIGDLEEMIYGRTHPGSLVERLERLERDLWGETRTGPLLARVEAINDELTRSGMEGSSLLLRLNAVEWMLNQEVTSGQPLARRIEQVEVGVWGERQTGPFSQRLANMMELVWPGGRLNVAEVEVPAQTLVKIRLLEEVNSGNARVDQLVPYRVASDVMVDGRLVLPAGTEGKARVVKVEAAGSLGRSGRVELDFGVVRAIDGTDVRMNVDERAAEQNAQAAAAAASVAGAVLLGPIGLVSGYFVRGQDHVIPAGSEFYVEVVNPVKVHGLSLVPVTE